MSTDYQSFLESKKLIVPSIGRVVTDDLLSAVLFPFQRDLVRWSLRKGRAALFCDTGLGKTAMQLEWGRHAAARTLILAPLAVAQQTVREGEKFGIPVTYARRQEDAPAAGITITNYEMLSHFDPDAFGAVALDESSILKAFEGKTRTALIEAFRKTPMRLCCTATPAPNDIAEIANHAEFLGVMSRVEMLAAFFVHDDAGWRLKGHAREPFYRWLASWGMSLKKPSDLGYSDDGYNLPTLSITPHFLETDYAPDGKLFADRLSGVTERASVRRQTFAARTAAAAALIEAEHREPWIAWCGLNDEADRLTQLIPGSVNVEGSQTPEQKAAGIEQFLDGRARVLVTKSQVAGFGLNLQHCARMVFVGMGDSWEQYYQCVRRCWRFGQQREVKSHVVLTDPERVIWDNVQRKEHEAEAMARDLVRHVARFERAEIEEQTEQDRYRAQQGMLLPEWIRQ